MWSTSVPRFVAGALAATLAASSACAGTLQIVTRQGAREAIVLRAGPVPAPTVIVLHGATATADRTARSSGFAEAAAAHGFVAVFPQGINRQWNDGREGRTAAVDDVGFLNQLLDELVGRGIADPARIFIAGISNGGMMTFRMLCEASEKFAGAATIIANMPAGIGGHCAFRKPVPIVMFNGTADPMVPYEGGSVGFSGQRGVVWSTARTAELMARANGRTTTAATPLPIGSSAELVHVTRLEWRGCRSSGGVTLYRFEGGGHQMPGRPEFLPRLLGPSSQQIRAAETALTFFDR